MIESIKDNSHRSIVERALHSEVQEDEEDGHTITGLIACPSVLGGKGGLDDESDDASHETDEEHPLAGVDLVVEPSTTRVID